MPLPDLTLLTCKTWPSWSCTGALLQTTWLFLLVGHPKIVPSLKIRSSRLPWKTLQPSPTATNSKPLPALFLCQGQGWKHPLNQIQEYQLLAWAFQWALEDPTLYRQSTNPDCSTLAEVKATIANFKNSKTTDICTITAEMLKAKGGDDVILWLTQIFNLAWVSKLLPDDWGPGVIHPFW